MVYSPLDALQIARKRPDKEVILFGLGSETSMPSTAMTLIQARAQGVRNFSLFCSRITIIPTIKAILDSPDHRLDGLLGPGHVSMVIGTRFYTFIAEHYQKPITIAGFEPLGIRIREQDLPIDEVVRGACLLYLANEGKMIAVVSTADSARVLRAMRAPPAGANAAVIGEGTVQPAGMVVLETAFGGERIVDFLVGEQLPRIC